MLCLPEDEDNGDQTGQTQSNDRQPIVHGRVLGRVLEVSPWSLAILLRLVSRLGFRTTVASRASSVDMISWRSFSSRLVHCAISSPVRPQPKQYPVLSSIEHTRIQGDEMGLAGVCVISKIVRCFILNCNRYCAKHYHVQGEKQPNFRSRLPADGLNSLRFS